MRAFPFSDNLEGVQDFAGPTHIALVILARHHDEIFAMCQSVWDDNHMTISGF